MVMPTRVSMDLDLQLINREKTGSMSIRQIKKIPVFHQSGHILVEFTKQKELGLKTASIVTLDDCLLGTYYVAGRSRFWCEGRGLPVVQPAHFESEVPWRHLTVYAEQVVIHEGWGWRTNELGEIF